MTKSTITRERLEELAAGQSGFNLRIATHEESQELARMALSTMDSEPVAQDEREAFEAFMAKRFGDLVDQRRAKNGDHGYMAWDMVVAWIVWQARAAMLQAEPVTTANKLGNSRCGTKGAPALDSSSKNAESRCGNSPAIPDGWIECSDQTPPDKEYVWCWGTYDDLDEPDGFEGYYDATRGKWWTLNNGDYVDGGYGGEYKARVTHWMPLPAAPQEVTP